MPHYHGRLFLDANVIFSGCHSQTGASAIILDMCMAKLLNPVTSALVMSEVSKAILNKSTDKGLQRFTAFAQSSALELVKSPSPAENDLYEKIIHSKNRHVLAAAVMSHCDFILTLDMKHFFTQEIAKSKLPLQMATPGQFLGFLMNENPTP